MNVLDNPNFIQWFGTSVIKDSEGNPITCYKSIPVESKEIGVPGGLEQKAIFLTYSKKEALSQGGNAVPLYVKMEMPFDISNRKKSKDYIEWRLKHNTMESVVDYARRIGRDGVIDRARNTLMVFTSNQVKSADRNNGGFSLESNNLYEAVIPETNPNLIDAPISRKLIKYYGITDNPYTKEQLEWFFKYPLDPLSQYTEMAYPAGFSMETLLSFSSYSDRIKYANKNLEYINHGSSRTVFGVDEKKVLKVARDDRGLAQNGAEVRFSKKQIPICARVFKWADDNSFIEMERAEPIDDMAIFEYGTGITSMSLFHEYLGELSYREDKVNIKGFTDNPWVQELVKFAKDNKYELPGDFTTLSAYGIVHRKEGWRVVIIDYGFTPSVHNDYY